jgi:hypothetical protein
VTTRPLAEASFWMQRTNTRWRMRSSPSFTLRIFTANLRPWHLGSVLKTDGMYPYCLSPLAFAIHPTFRSTAAELLDACIGTKSTATNTRDGKRWCLLDPLEDGVSRNFTIRYLLLMLFHSVCVMRAFAFEDFSLFHMKTLKRLKPEKRFLKPTQIK